MGLYLCWVFDQKRWGSAKSLCHSGLSLTSKPVTPAVWKQYLSSVKSKFVNITSKNSDIINQSRNLIYADFMTNETTWSWKTEINADRYCWLGTLTWMLELYSIFVYTVPDKCKPTRTLSFGLWTTKTSTLASQSSPSCLFFKARSDHMFGAVVDILVRSDLVVTRQSQGRQALKHTLHYCPFYLRNQARIYLLISFHTVWLLIECSEFCLLLPIKIYFTYFIVTDTRYFWLREV